MKIDTYQRRSMLLRKFYLWQSIGHLLADTNRYQLTNYYRFVLIDRYASEHRYPSIDHARKSLSLCISSPSFFNPSASWKVNHLASLVFFPVKISGAEPPAHPPMVSGLGRGSGGSVRIDYDRVKSGAKTPRLPGKKMAEILMGIYFMAECHKCTDWRYFM